jgi:F-type H+-transporting ATPase subunit b
MHFPKNTRKGLGIRAAFPAWAICLCLGACFVFFIAASSKAQEPSSDKSASTSRENPGKHYRDPHSAHAELAKEEREINGEDQENQLNHSASVRYIAAKTGLSLDQAYWVSTLINFGVVVGLVVWVAKKHLPGMLQGRTAFIQKAMADAQQESEEARRRLLGIEERLSRLDAEILRMKAAAESDSVAEESRLKAAAAEETRKIVDSAEQEIASALKSARRDLTIYTADLAVSLASQRIKVDTGTDRALVAQFLNRLPADAEAPRGNGGKSETTRDQQ